MMCCFASMNTKGFQSSISYGDLPQPDHLTYEGAFNELSFSIGGKATKSMQLHLGYARCQNLHSSFDCKSNKYLALFTKGAKDGQQRDQRILNSVICLDISGSMSSGLTRNNNDGNRLSLAKQAIKMYFSRMRKNDSFGLVVFDNKADTLIPVQMKSQINQKKLFQIIQGIKTRGGTTLMSGFNQSRNSLISFIQSNNYSKMSSVQNRILMLTDVGDNSIYSTQQFVRKVAQSENIHTTIIGISDDFRSQTCQKLNQVQGFNYFCATQVPDLKKYLFENFNYTFFPSNYGIQIELIQNKNVKSFQVYGTVDAKKVGSYNSNFCQKSENLIITKTKTSFPSQIQIDKSGNLKQFGGLIMIKLNLFQDEPQLQVKIKLSYKTPKGQIQQQKYTVKFDMPQNQQFYSEQCLSQAMPAFFYVYEIKNILEQIKNTPKKTKEYFISLQKLRTLCPESKRKELQDMIKLLKDQNIQSQDIQLEKQPGGFLM